MADKYRKEKKVHNELLDLLKEHFLEDEEEILDEEEDDEGVDSLTSKGGIDPDLDYDSDEEMFQGEDDDYYNELMEEQDEEEDEETPGSLDKDHRKNLAIVVLTKKAGMGNRKKSA